MQDPIPSVAATHLRRIFDRNRAGHQQGVYSVCCAHPLVIRAALELAELNAGDVFRLAVRRELKRRPDSLFSSRARLVA